MFPLFINIGIYIIMHMPICKYFLNYNYDNVVAVCVAVAVGIAVKSVFSTDTTLIVLAVISNVAL